MSTRQNTGNRELYLISMNIGSSSRNSPKTNSIIPNTAMCTSVIFVGISTKTCTSSSIAENCGYVANTHSNHQKEKNNSEAACIIIQAVFCLCQNA